MQALIAPQPRRVLVVEDEWLLREMLADALDEAGYATSMVFSVAEALRKLRQPMPVDLVIADMDLPDAEDGRDLAAFLALERPEVSVLVMSVRSPQSLPDGAHFLRKPVSPTLLLHELSELAPTSGAADSAL